MTKIFFPYNDQPIRFPFYVNDLVYIWEVGSDGIKVQLLNNQIDPANPAIRDIVLEDTGISFYLVNEQANTSKHVIVDFDKIGMGVEMLGLLDPFILKDIDPFTLGDISVGFVDLMRLTTSTSTSKVDKNAEASDAQMKLDSNCVLPYDKHIYPTNLHEIIGIVGLFDADHVTLGELDSRIFSDIDLMLSVFRAFHSIPAQLVKEIRINQRNRIDNGIMCAFKDFSTGATGITHYLRSDSIITVIRNISVLASEAEFAISVSGKAKSNTVTVVGLSDNQSSINNSNVSLLIQSDEITE